MSALATSTPSAQARSAAVATITTTRRRTGVNRGSSFSLSLSSSSSSLSPSWSSSSSSSSLSWSSSSAAATTVSRAGIEYPRVERTPPLALIPDNHCYSTVLPRHRKAMHQANPVHQSQHESVSPYPERLAIMNSRILANLMPSHVTRRRYNNNNNNDPTSNNYSLDEQKDTRKLAGVRLVAYKPVGIVADLDLPQQQGTTTLDSYESEEPDDMQRAVRQMQRNAGVPSEVVALKFLLPFGRNIDKACQRFIEHEQMRRRERLHKIWIFENVLIKEIYSCKFSVLPITTDNPLILILNLRYHDISVSSTLLTLRAFICHLDAALESNVDIIRNELIFIFDMSEATKFNYDFALTQKIIKLLKEASPVKVKDIYVVSPPSWLEPVYKVTTSDAKDIKRMLNRILPLDQIPQSLGGARDSSLDEKWPRRCVDILADKKNAFLNRYYTIDKPLGYEPSNRPSQSNILRDSVSENIDNNNGIILNNDGILNNGTNNSLRQRKISSMSGMRNDFSQLQNIGFQTVKEFIKMFTSQQKALLTMQYEYELVDRINAEELGTTESFRDPAIQTKNRYADVLCYDQTRVRLRDTTCGHDYIHANFVDGANTPRSFISTQGPLEDTCNDFWQMIWEQKVAVIVMVTKTNEQGYEKCSQYWPLTAHGTMVVGQLYIIKNVTSESSAAYYKQKCDIKSFAEFNMSILKLIKKSSDSRAPYEGSVSRAKGSKIIASGSRDEHHESRFVCHFQYLGWPDYGVPQSPDTLINMRQAVRSVHRHMVKDIYNREAVEPPIVVHCSAGIGRTGTFCIIDICLSFLERTLKDLRRKNATTNEDLNRDEMTAQIPHVAGVLQVLRYQRAHSVQNVRQYVFCYEAILHYLCTRLSVATRRSAARLMQPDRC